MSITALRSAVACAACLATAVAVAQTATFTEQQAAAGRASYLANCAGCHLPDLRGSNEARPLSGADFMRSWSARTTQDLVAFMGAAMPPAPAAPGSLGVPTYVNLAAFLLAANGAHAGNAPLTADAAIPIGGVADGAMPAGFREALASATPAAAGGGGRRVSRCRATSRA